MEEFKGLHRATFWMKIRPRPFHSILVSDHTMALVAESLNPHSHTGVKRIVESLPRRLEVIVTAKGDQIWNKMFNKHDYDGHVSMC